MKEKFKEVLFNIFFSFMWIALLVVIVDFVTKQVVLHNMNVGDQIYLIPNFLSINFLVNDGMAFSLNFNIKDPTWRRVVFALISVIGGAIIMFMYVRNYKKLSKLSKIALALMFAGCFGNLIDRAFYSQEYLSRYASGVEHYGVIDFIGLDFGSYYFPRFNIADAALVIGTIILIVVLIVEEVREARAKAKKERELESNEKLISQDEKVINAPKEMDNQPAEEVKESNEQ